MLESDDRKRAKRGKVPHADSLRSVAPAAGNGTCGSQTLSSGLTGASYTNTFVYTHLGQLWQGPLNGSSTSYQYFYCESGPHQLTGLYSTGTTCANKASVLYKSSSNAWGDVTGRTYPSAINVTLASTSLDQFVRWTTGTGSNEFYAYHYSPEPLDVEEVLATCEWMSNVA